MASVRYVALLDICAPHARRSVLWFGYPADSASARSLFPPRPCSSAACAFAASRGRPTPSNAPHGRIGCGQHKIARSRLSAHSADESAREGRLATRRAADWRHQRGRLLLHRPAGRAVQPFGFVLRQRQRQSSRVPILFLCLRAATAASRIVSNSIQFNPSKPIQAFRSE
jgi:hypothetical protein